MKDIEFKLNLTREKLVVMALIVGCDYDTKGLQGIGKESVCKFFNELHEYEERTNTKVAVFDMVRKWRSKDYVGLGLIMEDKFRRIAFQNESFPNEKIIDEFLRCDKKDKEYLASKVDLKIPWRSPMLYYLQVFANKKVK